MVVNDVNLVTTRRLQGEVQREGHIFDPHVGPEFPLNNITALVIEDGSKMNDFFSKINYIWCDNEPLL